MKKLIALAVLGTASIGAHAGITTNGVGLNGVTLNGLDINGINLNGLDINGIRLNGLPFNGIQPNGITFNALTSNGAQPQQANPLSTLATQPLAK